ncbi:lipopolysaccharide biosynthesis protein [Allopontixanthobacter confluentis]|uniref:lipopolysaccharide biosynthesis protein n=1 Tax=Allopontixanthobacter confluentis TaxID=1849021 RepID=UPI001E5F70EE|nr:oligosaccharide flippase family protein [Allopontixanthobacter confluentis]
MNRILSFLKGEFFVLVALTIVGGLANLGTQAALALFLTPEQLGRLASILSMAYIFVPIASFGIYGVWVRLFAENDSALADFVGAGLKWLFIASTLCYIIFAIIGFFREAASIYALLGLTIVARALQEAAGGAHQAEQNYRSFALLQCWPYILRICVVFSIGPALQILGMSPFFAFSIGQGIFAAILISLCVIDLRRFNKRYKSQRIGLTRFGDIFRRSNPFILSSLLFVAYTNAGVIITSHFAGFADAGRYALASSVAMGGFMLSSVIYQRYLQPRMFRWRVEDRLRFVNTVKKGTLFNIILSGSLLIFFFLISKYLIYIFSDEYAEAANIIAAFGVVVALRCIASHFSVALVRHEDLKYRSRFQLYGFAFVIPAMILGAASIGALGVVYASIFYEGFMLISYSIRAWALVSVMAEGRDT